MLFLILFENPLAFFMIATAIIFALSIHEYSHALVADFLGDHTAKLQGRLTINPLAHLDPMGTLFLFIAGFGWGKPVPFNPYNLRNQKWGPGLIALAGPTSNFLMAITAGLGLQLLGTSNTAFIDFFSVFIWINVLLGVFNLMPIFPLDGSHILSTFFPQLARKIESLFLKYSIFVLVGMLLFMIYIVIPFVCIPLFSLIIGGALPF
ncbi:site-2 protease family protein [Candidatus Parcubacteria bacterium]|nr:site-2 protease family protein [Candidatus Parcubacteria bacterium]